MPHLENPHASLHPSLRVPLRKCLGSLPSVPSSPSAYLCRAPHFCLPEVSKHHVSPLNAGRRGTTLPLHTPPPPQHSPRHTVGAQATLSG